MQWFELFLDLLFLYFFCLVYCLAYFLDARLKWDDIPFLLHVCATLQAAAGILWS